MEEFTNEDLERMTDERIAAMGVEEIQHQLRILELGEQLEAAEAAGNVSKQEQVRSLLVEEMRREF